MVSLRINLSHFFPTSTFTDLPPRADDQLHAPTRGVTNSSSACVLHVWREATNIRQNSVTSDKRQRGNFSHEPKLQGGKLHCDVIAPPPRGQRPKKLKDWLTCVKVFSLSTRCYFWLCVFNKQTRSTEGWFRYSIILVLKMQVTLQKTVQSGENGA